ncbi:MAG: serine hydrolase, partial [Flavitalea sp.]
ITESSYSGQTPVYNDPTSVDGKPSIAQYIKKIFLVSDNDASNRLYEFLGQEYLNKLLRSKGYRNAEIIHRLSIKMTEQENQVTNPVTFLNDSGLQIYDQAAEVSNFKLKNRNIFLGKGFIEEGNLIYRPFDFSRKNQLPLYDLHSILKTFLFPSSVRKKIQFNISPYDRQLVLEYMSMYPAESKYPEYDSTRIWDGYGKFLLWGSEKQHLPKHIRIFNKIGSAYGFVTDVAYVVDFEKNIEFLVSSTIYCNRDRIFNDDKYEYSSVGLPFMKWLGQVLYNYESTRSRKYQPDLTEFKMDYEK